MFRRRVCLLAGRFHTTVVRLAFRRVVGVSTVNLTISARRMKRTPSEQFPLRERKSYRISNEFSVPTRRA